MANKSHVEILEKGIDFWNQWRADNPETIPDLEGINLFAWKLDGINFSQANLMKSTLSYISLNYSNLSQAKLRLSDLFHSSLVGTDLSGAALDGSDLSHSYLSRSKIDSADLSYANLTNTILIGTSFRQSSLIRTNFTDAVFQETDFSEAWISRTILINNDLSTIKGLDRVNHAGPSDLNINTLNLSKGRIPDSFLRGIGIQESFISSMPSIISQTDQFYSCFISYSSKNETFVKRLHMDLQSKGVPCWYAPKDLKIGEKIRITIDASIREHDRLLLVLSKYSVGSSWVEKEVETAMEQERINNRVVLLPIRLDDAVMEVENGWPADIRRMRNIGDFRGWKRQSSYQRSLVELLQSLRIE